MKKIIFYISILVISMGLLPPFYTLGAQTTVPLCDKIPNTTGIPYFNGTKWFVKLAAGGLCVAIDEADAKASATNQGEYKLLQPLPCVYKDYCGKNYQNDTQFLTFNPGSKTAFGVYLNILIKLCIGIAAVLTMVMIMIGGIEYMTSELVSHKQEGRERITNAILGLLLALGAYTLLFTVNSDLLSTD